MHLPGVMRPSSDDWAERAARRADGSLDNEDARALAVTVRRGLMDVANAFAARFAEIDRDDALDEGGRRHAIRAHAHTLLAAVAKLDVLVARVAQRRDELARDLVPHFDPGQVDPPMWPAIAALWPLLPADNSSLLACYHDACRQADRLTMLAIETLPRTLHPHALTSEQIADASEARLAMLVDQPGVGSAAIELCDLREALGEIMTIREAVAGELGACGEADSSQP